MVSDERVGWEIKEGKGATSVTNVNLHHSLYTSIIHPSLMSKLASLAKQRAANKRPQPAAEVPDVVEPDLKKPQLSSISLLDKLHKKQDTDQPTSNDKPLSKLASKARANKLSTSSTDSSTTSISKLSFKQKPKPSPAPPVAAPPVISAADMFPEIDFSYPYDPMVLDSATKSHFTALVCQQNHDGSTSEDGMANYIYPPASQQLYSAFNQPSPDDVVLEAQSQAKKFDGTVQNGIAKMSISDLRATQDDFSNSKNSINFFIIGK